MKDRPLFDKVSLGIAIVSAIFAGLSFFSQIGLLGGKSTDSQAGIEELADTIVAENSMTSEAANLGNGEANSYYWQCYHLVQAEEASGFIVAILPYGFYEENSYKLMMLAGADEKMSSAYAGNDVDSDRVISEYKEQLHPNTYGIIDINYKEYIYPCVDEDETYWAACVKELMKD